MLTGFVAFGDCTETRGAENRPFGFIGLGQLLRCRSQKKIVTKKVGIGQLGNHPNIEAVGGVGTGIGIPGIDGFATQIGSHPIVKGIKIIRRKRNINIPPPDGVFGDRILHHKTVFGRTTGKFPGIRCQGPVITELSFTARQSRLNQFGRTQIPVYVLHCA